MYRTVEKRRTGVTLRIDLFRHHGLEMTGKTRDHDMFPVISSCKQISLPHTPDTGRFGTVFEVGRAMKEEERRDTE